MELEKYRLDFEKFDSAMYMAILGTSFNSAQQLFKWAPMQDLYPVVLSTSIQDLEIWVVKVNT